MACTGGCNGGRRARPVTTIQVSSTVYDVALNGKVLDSFEAHQDALDLRDENPGSQIRTRAEVSTVPAAFAVFVDGVQLGEATRDTAAAAKAAKLAGGQLKIVPA